MMNAQELIKAAWTARAPLIWLQAPDTLEALDYTVAAVTNGAKPPKTWTWSPVTGWDKGRKEPPSLNPTDAILEIAEAPQERTLYVANRLGEGLQNDVPFAAACQLARRKLAAVGSTLVFVVPSGALPPPSIAADFIQVSLPLPDDNTSAQLAQAVVNDYFASSQIAKESGLQPEKIVQSLTPYLRGLTRFGVEQVAAVAAVASARSKQIDMAAAQIARAQMLATAGLRVIQPEPVELPGLEGLTDWISRFPVQAVVWMDEIEKAIAGYGLAGKGDSSGVTQDQLSVILTTMQEYRMFGLILVGPPGTGKSESAKQAGLRLGVPVVQLDLGSLKGSYVGESEQRVRRAMAAIAGLGRVMVIATSNGIDSVPPELRRRFALGTWFCDLPDTMDRAKIWAVWGWKCKIDDNWADLAAASEGYAGSDIAMACTIASTTGRPIREVMERITPVGVVAAELRARLQQAAAGRWLSAKTGKVCPASPQTRKFTD
jgi:hypothetical protein